MEADTTESQIVVNPKDWSVQDSDVMEYIEKYQDSDGIGNLSFEKLAHSKAVLHNLDALYEVFKDDPMRDDTNGAIRELHIEYFIISVYLLVRHLATHYVWQQAEKQMFRKFVIAFHQRWKKKSEDDRDIVAFSDSRQQTSNEVEARHRCDASACAGVTGIG